MPGGEAATARKKKGRKEVKKEICRFGDTSSKGEKNTTTKSKRDDTRTLRRSHAQKKGKRMRRVGEGTSKSLAAHPKKGRKEGTTHRGGTSCEKDATLRSGRSHQLLASLKVREFGGEPPEAGKRNRRKRRKGRKHTKEGRKRDVQRVEPTQDKWKCTDTGRKKPKDAQLLEQRRRCIV